MKKKVFFFCGNIKDFAVPYFLILFRYVATLQTFRASCGQSVPTFRHKWDVPFRRSVISVP